RVGERIIAHNGCIARAFFVQRSEPSRRMNVALWFRIDQPGVEVQGLAGTNVFQLQVANVEFQWRLASLIRVDDKFRIRAHEVVYENTHLYLSAALPQVLQLLP